MPVCHIVIVAFLALQYFSTSSHKWHDFWKKKGIKHKLRVLIFSVIFVWNISHFEKHWAEYDKKCVLVIMSGTCYSCQTVVKLEFSWHIFKKIDFRFYENPSSGGRVVPCGQMDGRTDRKTDGHDEANSCFLQFANGPKKKMTACIWHLFEVSRKN